jgi:hypothetical protein
LLLGNVGDPSRHTYSREHTKQGDKIDSLEHRAPTTQHKSNVICHMRQIQYNKCRLYREMLTYEPFPNNAVKTKEH